MPGNDYDQYLEDTYGNEDVVLNDNGPIPFSADTSEVNPIDSDISAFVDNSAGLPSSPSPNESPVPSGLIAPPDSQMRSVSGSRSGYNLSDEKSAQIAKVGGVLDQRIAASGAELDAEGSQTAKEFQDALGSRAETVAQKELLDTKVAGERQKFAELEADAVREYRFQERVSYEKARLAEEEAMANYQASVKQFEASNINPGKLWGDMSAGDKFGAQVSVFAAGILAAKGINTEVMNNINRAIDQNISAQQANMDKKGKSVGMFKQAWDMVRAESESESEARLKMHNLMLSEVKSALTARLMSYDSDYAKLKAQESFATLEMEQANKLGEIREAVRTNKETGRNFELQRWGKEQDLRLESARVGLAAREVKLKEDAAKGTEELEKPEVLVRDPVNPDGTGGEVVGAAGDKERAKELQKGWNATVKSQRSVARLAELSRDLGQIYDGPGKAAFMSKHKSELQSLVNELEFEEAVRLTGLTATDAQLDRIKQIRGTVDGWTKGIFGGDGETLVYTQAQKTLRDLAGMEDNLRTGLYDVSPATKARYKGVDVSGRPGVVLPEVETETLDKKKETTEATKLIGQAVLDKDSVKTSPETIETLQKALPGYIEEFNTYESGLGRAKTVPKYPDTAPRFAANQVQLAELVKNKDKPMEARKEAVNFLMEETKKYGHDKGEQFTFGPDTPGILSTYLINELIDQGHIDFDGNILFDSIEQSDPSN